MKAHIRDKLTSKWRSISTLILELYDGDWFAYEDYYAMENGEQLYDCSLKIELHNTVLQYEVQDGRLQNL